MVSDPELTTRKVCKWYEVPWSPDMINTTDVYNRYIENSSGVDEDFLKRHKVFHSGLFQKPNTKKIGQYKNILDEKVLAAVQYQNSVLLPKFGYDIQPTNAKFSIFSLKWHALRAWCYRTGLLQFYYLIPLRIKLLIKKVRRKSPSV
jgi:hypothetical protein